MKLLQLTKALILINAFSLPWAHAFLPEFSRTAQEMETTSAPVAGKKTVCTITINSSNERDLFEKKLSKQHFQFVELTLVKQWAPQTDAKKSWFDRACDSQIQCDMLIVSGHFGGTFFGSSGHTLSFSDMENRSCRKDCNGILSNPKEVFLFGCNTLASKDADGRTRDQYIQALRDEGYSLSQAEEVAEARYGNTGEQNRDRMRRAFLNVPYIYGFSTKAPLGDTISPYLSRYIDKALPYEDHLAMLTANPQNNAYNFPNELIKATLKDIPHKGLTQCPGISGLNENDPYYKINANLCQFYTLIKDNNQKMRFAIELLRSNDAKVYFPAIIKFILDTRQVEFAAKKDLRGDVTVKELFATLLKDIVTPVMRSQWLVAGLHMNWISSEAYQTEGQNIYKKIFSEKIDNERSSVVCSLAFKQYTPISSQYIGQFIKPEHLQNSLGLQAVYCSGALLNTATQELLKNAISKTVKSDDIIAATMIGMLDFKGLKLNPTLSEIINIITEPCSSKVYLMPACLSAVTNVSPTDALGVRIANRMISQKAPDIRSGLKLLVEGRTRYAGSELDITYALKTANQDLKLYGNYFVLFPPTEIETQKIIIQKCKDSQYGTCNTLFEALQNIQLSPEDFTAIVNVGYEFMSVNLDFWKAIFVVGAQQNQFTPEMIKAMYKKEVQFYGQENLIQAFLNLAKNPQFQNALLQDEASLKNMCSGFNKHKSAGGCYNLVKSWKAAEGKTALLNSINLY